MRKGAIFPLVSKERVIESSSWSLPMQGCRAMRKTKWERNDPTQRSSPRTREQIPSFLDFSGETGWGGKLVSNSRRGAGSCAGVALWDRHPSASTPVARSTSPLGQVWPIFPKGRQGKRERGIKSEIALFVATTNSCATAAMAARRKWRNERRTRSMTIRRDSIWRGIIGSIRVES